MNGTGCDRDVDFENHFQNTTEKRRFTKQGLPILCADHDVALDYTATALAPYVLFDLLCTFRTACGADYKFQLSSKHDRKPDPLRNLFCSMFRENHTKSVLNFLAKGAACVAHAVLLTSCAGAYS